MGKPSFGCHLRGVNGVYPDQYAPGYHVTPGRRAGGYSEEGKTALRRFGLLPGGSTA